MAAKKTFKTPVKGYTGVIFGIPCAGGVLSTDNEWLITRLRESGYIEVVNEDNTIPEIKKYLEEQGVEYDDKATKADLLELVEE